MRQNRLRIFLDSNELWILDTTLRIHYWDGTSYGFLDGDRDLSRHETEGAADVSRLLRQNGLCRDFRDTPDTDLWIS